MKDLNAPGATTMFVSRINSNPKIKFQKALNYKPSLNGLDSQLVMNRTLASNTYQSQLLTKQNFSKDGSQYFGNKNGRKGDVKNSPDPSKTQNLSL